MGMNPSVQGALAVMQAQQNKLNSRNATAIDQERLAAEIEDRKANRDLALKKFDEELNLHKQQHLADIAAANLTRAQVGQQLSEHYVQTGIAPAGSQINSFPTGPGTPFPIGSQTPQSMTIPGAGTEGSDFNIPLPDQSAITDAAKRQADLARITNQPDIEKRAAELKATYENQKNLEDIRQTGENKRQSDLIAANAALDKARQDQENYRARLQRETQMNVAMLPYNAMGANDPATIQNMAKVHLDAMYNGDETADDFHKDFQGKGLAPVGTRIMGQMLQSGFNVPTKANVSLKQGLANITPVLGHISSYIQSLPQTDSVIGAGIKGITNADMFNPDRKALKDQIELEAANIAKLVGGDQGQRLQKAMLDYSLSFMPTPGKTTSANVSNYNNFLKQVNNITNTGLANLPKIQRDNIKKQLGLDQYQPLDPKTGQPVAVSKPVVNNAPSGQPGQRIRVKIGNQTGTVDASEFNPQTMQQLDK